jgi:hypothetical protein
MEPTQRYIIKQTAIELLWTKRSMLPENSEEIIDDVLDIVEKTIGSFEKMNQ